MEWSDTKSKVICRLQRAAQAPTRAACCSRDFSWPRCREHRSWAWGRPCRRRSSAGDWSALKVTYLLVWDTATCGAMPVTCCKRGSTTLCRPQGQDRCGASILPVLFGIEVLQFRPLARHELGPGSWASRAEDGHRWPCYLKALGVMDLG
jgi:hypothetical protein